MRRKVFTHPDTLVVHAADTIYDMLNTTVCGIADTSRYAHVSFEVDTTKSARDLMEFYDRLTCEKCKYIVWKEIMALKSRLKAKGRAPYKSNADIDKVARSAERLFVLELKDSSEVFEWAHSPTAAVRQRVRDGNVTEEDIVHISEFEKVAEYEQHMAITWEKVD